MDSASIDAALANIKSACNQFLASPYRRGSELLFPPEGDLVVTGDLHGDVASFEQIVAAAGLEKNRLRHLILQELVHGQDQPHGDGGSCALIERAAALAVRFPNRVHILMGNHEMAELTGRVLLKDGVILNEAFRKSAEARYGERAEEAFAYLRRFWRALPLAARTANRVFISHSTPSGKAIEQFDPAMLRRPIDDLDLLRDTGSAYALLWGRDFSPQTAGRLLEMLDVDYLVSGHTPCDEGYSAPNGRHIILDSQGPNGRYLLMPLAGRLTYESLVGMIRAIWA